MKNKIPKIFNKNYTKEDLERDLLKYLDSSNNLKFLKDIFIKDGEYLKLKKDLTKNDIKKLKNLAKTIKSNKSNIRKNRLIVVGIFIVIILLFNFFFKNKLVETAIEKSLELSFKAKANVKNVKLKLLQGNLSFDSLEVANKEKPMYNLFELGYTDIDINTSQLLRKKIIIDKFITKQLKWDTKRKYSGKLIKTKSETKKSAAKKIEKNIKQDINKILEEQMNQLQSPQKIEEINEKIKDINQKWSENIETTKEDIQSIKKSYNSLSNTNFDKIEDKTKIKDTIENIKTLQSSLKNVKSNINTMNSDFNSDLKYINNSRKMIDDIYKNDINFVKQKLNLPSTSKNIFKNILNSYLKRKLGKFYKYVEMGKGAVNKKKKPDKETKKVASKNRNGYFVPFKTVNYPKFLLKLFDFSLEKDSSSKELSLNIKDLTPNHKLIGKPSKLEFYQKERNNTIQVKGSYDTRENIEDKINLIVNTRNYPFSITEMDNNEYISGIKGQYNIKLSYSEKKEKKKGSLSIGLKNLLVESKSDDKIAAILKQILENTTLVNINAEFNIEDSEIANLKVNSNIDNQIKNSLGKYMSSQLGEYEKMIKEKMDGRLKDRLNLNSDLLSKNQNLLDNFQDNKKMLNNYDNMIGELKKKATKKMGSSIFDKVLDIFK